jgi:oligoendopeptidase F
MLGAMSTAATAPTDAARPQPNWDLTAYFSDVGAPDYAEFRARLSADAAALRIRAEGLSAIPDSEPAAEAAATRAAWVAVLLGLEDASARVRHLSSFLGCRTAADATDEVSARESSGLDTIRTDLDKAMVAIRAGFGAATPAGFAALAADARLAGATYYLDRIRIRAAQSMEPDLEGLAADLAPTALRAWGRLYDQVSGTLRFTHAVPGRAPEVHPVSMTRTLLEDGDPAVRRAALDGSAAAWKGVADTIAACLNAISGTRLVLYRRRGIGHFLEPALFDAGIERATLDAMLGVVRRRQEVARRYLRRKATLLGMPRLGFQDLMAPLPRPDAGRIGWADGCRRVRDAFGAAYPGLADLATRAFDGRWIDHEPRAGKRPGGFCTSSYLIGESRVFMTYHGALGDVQTLAHELGHAFHNWLMRDLRPWARSYPMTLAETASTFAEELVIEATLAAPETSEADRTAILDARLQDAAVFLCNIPMRFDFEQKVYEERATGELPVSRLEQLICEAQRANYGDALDGDQLDPWFWASKLHFYIADVAFYNFPYTFGYLFSKGIVARFRAEGPSFLPRYEALLRATGGDTAENVAAATLGIDLRDPAFWSGAIDLIEADLERFEALPAPAST